MPLDLRAEDFQVVVRLTPKARQAFARWYHASGSTGENALDFERLVINAILQWMEAEGHALPTARIAELFVRQAEQIVHERP